MKRNFALSLLTSILLTSCNNYSNYPEEEYKDAVKITANGEDCTKFSRFEYDDYIFGFPHGKELLITRDLKEVDINIEFDKINKAPASNRKHFGTAKEIAELVIKKYYFSNCADKKIINYIDEYLPSNYTKNKDINKVVWYFIVCVVTFNKQVVLSESAKGDD